MIESTCPQDCEDLVIVAYVYHSPSKGGESLVSDPNREECDISDHGGQTHKQIHIESRHYANE